jgi:DNA-binding PadR family transcriptional regulator
LFVLGALARRGPMYGHQIRRHARLDRTELWSEVKPGSLYGALHRLESEGLIEPVRTEQPGNRPARTVYAITGEGHEELRALRAEALGEVAMRPDPVDLALAASADLDEDALRAFFADRRQALASRAAFFAHERERAWPDQTAADDLIIEHAIARIEAELRWHDVVLDRIGKVAAENAENAEKAEKAETSQNAQAARSVQNSAQSARSVRNTQGAAGGGR